MTFPLAYAVSRRAITLSSIASQTKVSRLFGFFMAPETSPANLTDMAKQSRLTERGSCFWNTERLWTLSQNLPVKMVSLDSIAEFDQNCWFDAAHLPTCRAVAAHARRIGEADLSHPIILSAEGFLVDGGHRLGKASLLGLTEIAAVQFEADPEPDWIEAISGAV